MIVRDASPADLPEIAAIQSGSPEAAHWAPADYLTHDCRVALIADRVAGFLVARETAPGEREILNLAVAPSHRRQGIARKLLEDELARPASARFLEVRESNAAAIALYSSVGFEIAGRRPEYYNNPPETGVVMRFLS